MLFLHTVLGDFAVRSRMEKSSNVLAISCGSVFKSPATTHWQWVFLPCEIARANSCVPTNALTNPYRLKASLAAGFFAGISCFSPFCSLDEPDTKCTFATTMAPAGDASKTA